MVIILGFELSAQTGQSFWFVAPDITAGHGDNPISIRVTTYTQASTITLSMPADPSFTPMVVNVAANSFHTFDLTPFINQVESQTHNQVDVNGIYISSTANIAAYYEIGPFNNTDIFALKADNALGTEFFLSGQSYWKSGNYNPQPHATSHIVATENGTQVTITPSVAILNHPAGVPFTITLNQGETYTIRAAGTKSNQRFAGTHVTSNKPIAITITDDSLHNSSYGGCKDVVGDQTIPVNKIGKEYILVKGFLGNNGNKPDRIYIMAIEDSTNLYFDGSVVPNTTLNKGGTHEQVLNNASLHISADKPVYVMHVTGFGCEVGMAIVPSIYCTGSNEVSFNRSQGGDFYMVVIVPNGFEGDFQVNGNNGFLKANDFQTANGTGGAWKIARKKFNQGQIKIDHSYRVTNSQSKFHLGIINGTKSDGCLYGYFTDFGSVITGPIYHF